jgi:pSer/pThr/pTyr-binding forkhead associated (FHA) protein
VEDLGSRNGTWVNGTRVQRCQLRAGDLVAAGEQHLRID